MFTSPFNIKQNNVTFNEKESYLAHHKQYSSIGKLELEKQTHQKYTDEQLQYNPGVPLGRIIDNFPEIKFAVDIGSGTGWAANLMSKKYEKVWAIEPSNSAVDIAKTIYGNPPNIDWINGFAEEEIEKLTLPNTPVLFNCLCVLSHLPDNLVSKICQTINKKAPQNSIISFSECWGSEHHENLWHVRTKQWWQSQFPNWNFMFIENQIQVVGRYKGLWAQKIN